MLTIDTNNRVSAPIVPQPIELGPQEGPEPIDPMIAQYRSDIGPLVNDRMTGLITETGPYAISRRNLKDRTFTFAEGTAFGLRIEERAYDAKDPYVQDCPVRRAVAENLRNAHGGQKVTFVESAGLMQLAGGYMGLIPVFSSPYGGVAANYGFTASTLMRYRASVPQVLGFGERPKTNFQDQKLAFFPSNSAKALQMAPGTEMEVTGQGRLLVNAAISARAGIGLDHASAGVGVVINGTTTTENETSLNILALDKPGKVRVTLRKVDEETAQILARINAGVLFGAGTLAPGVLGGMLRFWVEKQGAPNFETMLMFYTTLYATFSARAAHRGIAIGSWDLDLNTQDGQRAYDELLKLNTIPAEEIAHSGNPAVTDLHFKEKESEYQFHADAGGIGLKFFLFESLRTNRSGHLTETGGKDMIYKDSLYTRKKRNVFTGTKEINWEAVTINDGERHGKEPFLRVHFEQKDWDFGTNGVDRMLRFAEALQIPKAEIVGGDPAKLKEAAKKLANRAEVAITSDIYFTTKGVDRIDNATAEQARDAYLRVSATIHHRFHGIDLTSTDPKTQEAVRRIAEFRKLSLWGRVHEGKGPMLRDEYFELTGRKIDNDIRLMKEAEVFGAAVGKMHNSTKSKEEIAAFMDLAHREKFDYMQTVAALATLAGAEETLIHNLSISSGGIVIKSNAEGDIMSPRDEVTHELYRVSDHA